MKKLIATLVLAALAFSLNAEIWTPRIIGDNMILQRSEPVKIWGEALPDAEIEAKFGDVSAKTKADKDGKWLLELPAMEAAKVGKSIELYENGKLSKEIKNVVVGEVWIASGQSNMSLTMARTSTFKDAKKDANNASLRFFVNNLAHAKDEQKDSSPEAEWIPSSAEKLGIVSAVSYYFAETLNRNLDIPTGVIVAEKGGSPMIAWVPRADAADCPRFKEMYARWDESVKNYDYPKVLAKWEADMAAREKLPKAQRKRRSSRPNPNVPGVEARAPGYLFNGKLSFATNYTAKGFLWYQGETEGGGAKYFDEKLEGLAEIWRKRFHKPDMPFYFVQLPSFSPSRDWQEIRWAQFKASKKMKNAEMAVTIDSGDEKDIHPGDKKVVGERLASLALNKLYGKNVSAFSPEFKSVKYSGSECVVSFDMNGEKLVAQSEPKGVEVRIGKNWVATDKVSVNEKGMMTVKSPNGESIDGVRYLWKCWAKPDVFLYSGGGIPAMGFTDSKK